MIKKSFIALIPAHHALSPHLGDDEVEDSRNFSFDCDGFVMKSAIRHSVDRPEHAHIFGHRRQGLACGVAKDKLEESILKIDKPMPEHFLDGTYLRRTLFIRTYF